MLKALSSKKSIVLVVVLIALVTLPILIGPVRAWDPDQHIGMGNIVLDDLLYDSTPGKVTIKGVDYSASQLVYQAISSYPQYYKFGCIGPDGFPDIIFGQCAIHPGTGTEEGTEANVYSYKWFDYMLSQVYSQNDWEMSLKAIAFTYGFMSHAAGDMFCHTFTNRYTGGVWSLPTNGLRHVVVEAYVDQQTGWKDPPILTSGEYDSFSGDTAFRDWIYSTLIDNSWVRGNTSGGWADYFYGMFLKLRDKINDRLKEWKKDWWDRAWWATPPLGWVTEPYLKAWRDDINDGLKAWVGVSTQVAYDFFILGNTDAAKDALVGWFTDHFIEMLSGPLGTLLQDVIDALQAIGKGIEDLLDVVLGAIPGLKAIWDFVKNLYDQAKDAVVNWAFKLVFGVTLDDLKDFLKNPANYLDSPLFGATPDAAAAPFHPYTKEAVDNQIAFALQSGSFDPWRFDATYNTIMMGKLLLLDGAGLNKLLTDNGVTPLYTEEEGTNWQTLADSGMCVMRGFMKSLDSDHQWMLTAPSGRSYGDGDYPGMPLWEDWNARERVFKKIFHMGLNMYMTPTLDIVPGYTGTYYINVINTGNTQDTFKLSVNGLPTTWQYSISTSQVTLDPGANTYVSLYITPWRHWSTSVGDYPFTVKGESLKPLARPDYDLEVNKTEFGNVHVLPFYEPHMVATPKSLTTKPGGTVVYNLQITDFGNVPDTYTITSSFPDFDGTYRAYPTSIQPQWAVIAKTSMTLNPGTSDTTTLRITVPKDWAGMEPATYVAKPTATSTTDPTATSNDPVNLTVQLDNTSKTRYIGLELDWLIENIRSSTVCDATKPSLVQWLLEAKKQQVKALNYILGGNIYPANVCLKSCRGFIMNFISVAKLLGNVDTIPKATADQWIRIAQTIINDIASTISKLT
jgi:hypothetical protein